MLNINQENVGVRRLARRPQRAGSPSLNSGGEAATVPLAQQGTCTLCTIVIIVIIIIIIIIIFTANKTDRIIYSYMIATYINTNFF